VSLKLKANLQVIFEEPIHELAGPQLAKNGGQQDGESFSQAMLPQDLPHPKVVFSSADDKLNFVVRLKLVKVRVEIASTLTAARALEIHDLNHSRVHASDVDAASCLE
jgi:hypothetical protein